MQRFKICLVQLETPDLVDRPFEAKVDVLNALLGNRALFAGLYDQVWTFPVEGNERGHRVVLGMEVITLTMNILLSHVPKGFINEEELNKLTRLLHYGLEPENWLNPSVINIHRKKSDANTNTLT